MGLQRQAADAEHHGLPVRRQPPFHKGAAVAVFYLSGSDADGNYFSYSKRVNVSIT